MGIQPVLIYVISSLEPKFHWDGMKNECSTYVHLNMGKFQVRRIFGNADEGVLAVVKPLRSRFCSYRLQKHFDYSQSLD